jgi:glycosyltransferase involved in cell wall biosynthesis
MRVAHFVQRYPPALGGSEAYFARLSSYLVEAGDQVTVHTTNAVDLEAFWSSRGKTLRAGKRNEEGVQVHRHALLRLPEHRRVLKLLSFVPIKPWQCLTQSCNPIVPTLWSESGNAERRFDIVHASAFPYGFPLYCGKRLAQRLGVPFVVTPFLHLGDPDAPLDRTRRAYTSPALLSLLHAADAIFTQTTVERDALLNRGFPAEKVHLQGMGVDYASCQGGNRVAARALWGVQPHEVVVGHLANNSIAKGSVDLLRAAQRAWSAGSRFHLVLAGPEMPNFRSFWKNYSCANQVKRLGVLSAEEKKDFFAGIDLFALPSRSDSFGLVFLEAWANGIPNIAYRAGGVAGVIQHEKDGLLIKCGDIQGLAEAIMRLVANEALGGQLGRHGQTRLGKEFRWEDKLRMVRGVYESLHKGGGWQLSDHAKMLPKTLAAR